MSETDNWRTHPDDIADMKLLVGTENRNAVVFDLDPASNLGSVVPCRVAYVQHNGFLQPVPSADVVLQTDVSVGGGFVACCGLSRMWDPRLTVWNNPPYSKPSPWIAQIVLHAWRGGRGMAIVPANLLESAWGQALLWCAGVPRASLGQTTLDTEATTVLAPLFGGHGVPQTLNVAFYDLLVRVGAVIRPRGTMSIFLPTRRIGFIDADGVPQPANRIGTMIVTWGFGVSGVHTVSWPKREYGNVRYAALESK